MNRLIVTFARMPRVFCSFGGAALAFAALLASSAYGDLSVTVTPDVTPGQTVWQFSGSSIFSGTAVAKFAGGALENIEEWKGGAGSDYVKAGAYNNVTKSLISGTIGITVTPSGTSGVDGSIGGLHIDHDNSGDDFGVGLLGSDILVPDGAVVAWTGSGVFAVDIANLNPGLFTFSDYGGSQAGGPINGVLPITMSVVPEPSTWVMGAGGIACAAWGAWRRRKRA